MRTDEHPVIDDRKTQGGAQSHEHAHAHPAARARAIAQQEFRLQLRGELQTQPAASGDICERVSAVYLSSGQRKEVLSHRRLENLALRAMAGIAPTGRGRRCRPWSPAPSRA